MSKFSESDHLGAWVMLHLLCYMWVANCNMPDIKLVYPWIKWWMSNKEFTHWRATSWWCRSILQWFNLSPIGILQLVTLLVYSMWQCNMFQEPYSLEKKEKKEYNNLPHGSWSFHLFVSQHLQKQNISGKRNLIFNV